MPSGPSRAGRSSGRFCARSVTGLRLTRPLASGGVPSFCRHNRLIQNCPICSREQAIELRPVVSSSAPRSASRAERGQSRSTGGSRSRAGGSGRRAASRSVGWRAAAMTAIARRSLPGLKSSQEAERLAEELAFAVTRLDRLAADPPGLYAEVADPARRRSRSGHGWPS